MKNASTQNLKQEVITIQVELEIPLQAYEEEGIRKIVKNILYKQAKNIKLVSLTLDYFDSEDEGKGNAIFSVTLEGTESDLRKVAGDGKLFVFDWKEGLRSKMLSTH